MRNLSLILAFAFVLAGPSMAGSPDSLPAAGTFAYNGAPVANAAPLVLAARD
jgi:ABC-type nitrate/sulfonate/bicarbonate transport system substrate-binding protein